MAEFARSLSGPRSLDERLRAVTDEVLELMPPKTCAGILLLSDKRFETVAHLPTTSTSSTMHSINSDRDRVCGAGAQQSRGAKRRSSFGTALAAVRGGRSRCGDSQFDVLSAVYRRRKDGTLNLSAFSAHASGSEEEAAGEVLATHAA
nr:hypothetical protein GCM10017611_82250 [Rhodococcus wratislaviensis]